VRFVKLVDRRRDGVDVDVLRGLEIGLFLGRDLVQGSAYRDSAAPFFARFLDQRALLGLDVLERQDFAEQIFDVLHLVVEQMSLFAIAPGYVLRNRRRTQADGVLEIEQAAQLDEFTLRDRLEGLHRGP